MEGVVNTNNLKKLFMNEHKRGDIFCKQVDGKNNNGMYFDFSRCLLSENDLLNLLGKMKENVKPKVDKMFKGEKINFTENREVLHVLLRKRKKENEEIKYELKEKFRSVCDTREKIFNFSRKIQEGEILSFNGKKFKNVICVGIGGSYLGTEFVYQSLQACCDKSINLSFVSNIDPLDFQENIVKLDANETLVLIISKTFTTRETIINARSIRKWLLDNICKDKENEVKERLIISKHILAVSSNIDKVREFGIDICFNMWDWVGGRYSVWSAVGLLPLCLAFGEKVIKKFLSGGEEADNHFLNEDIENNIPYILGAISIYNTKNLKYNTRAVLPYSHALRRFPAHIQQLEMESNGKYVNSEGEKINITGEVIIGEPGTNGQHSFYQLLHQGTTVVPCEFIGFCKQKNNYKLDDNIVSNHDELMCNLFAQADALAFGKSRDELERESCLEELIPHKIFEGNRPSVTLLFKELEPWSIGFLLAIYEHRVAVQGFYLDINSFDQWGVELGKILATQIRNRLEGKNVILNKSTSNILDFYIKNIE